MAVACALLICTSCAGDTTQAATELAGKRFIYALHLESESLTHPGRILAQKGEEVPRTLAAALGARLVVTFLEHGDGDTTLALSFDVGSLRIAVTGVDDEELSRETADDLRPRLFVRTDGSGRAQTVWPAPGLHRMARSLQRLTVARLQLLPPSQSENSWEAEEEDANGRFLATYRWSEGSEQVLEKRKVHYLPRGDGTSTPVSIRPDSTTRIVMDQTRGVAKRLVADETLEFEMEDRLVARGSTTLRLDLLESHALPAQEIEELRREWCERDAAGGGLKATELMPPAEIRRNRYARTLGEDRLGDLTARLADPGSDRAELGRKLEALAFLQPESCAQMAEILNRSDTEGRARGLLIGSLAGAGHAKAQIALGDALRASPKDRSGRAALIIALGGVRKPTAASEALLRGLVDDPSVGSTAVLNLGQMARALTDTDPDRVAGIVDWILKRLESADSEGERRRLLLALGNAGSRRALPVLTHWLRRGPPLVRGGAAKALRAVDGEDVDALLTRALRSDPGSRVRIEAARALSKRTPTAGSLVALREAIREDESAEVRTAALRVLHGSGDDDPQVRAVVERAARSDPDPEVRKAAWRLLGEREASSESALPDRDANR